ncbi:hypothetical protein RCH09_003689 [Actimicrobium sp. GrIS 1.19]|uniref:hypothetical protein n=1 Tax=Actimicrobium sp. GrIS 1.19 TaxID=3071708 RepID=UPI002DF74F50|nr:hypothetical protein [Actimicrobium sp. GrIS 1.19]
MKPTPNLEGIAIVATLLEESTDAITFNAAMLELGANPGLMESLMAVQFVKDAIQGNPCPDKRYTAGIMQFIAEAERKRIADEKSDK